MAPPLTENENETLRRGKLVVETYSTGKTRRLLLAMLKYAPTLAGKLAVAAQILQSRVNEVWELDRLSDYYWAFIILPVRSAGGKTPAESLSPDGLFGEEGLQEINSSRERQAALNRVVAILDRYQCKLTGRYNYYVQSINVDWVPQDAIFDETQAAHILPLSLTAKGATTEHKAQFWTALSTFSGCNISALQGEGLDSVENALTMAYGARKNFAELKLALTPLPESPNKYDVLIFGSSLRRENFVNIVDLTNSNDSPPPNPNYIALHCAICNVLWASGRAEELDEIMCDIDDASVLAEDGSSAGLFEVAIQRSLLGFR